jgi:hypothetical protein
VATAGFAPRSGPRVPADTLTALAAAGSTRPLRIAPRVIYGRSPQSWKRFVTLAGGSWQAQWDLATGVPRRIWGSGIAAPGANADPAVAERVARQVLATHLALLAPGAAITDFTLTANRLDGDIRTVGFTQSSGGTPVLGGQISFEFKRDRLFVIGSVALPNVTVAAPRVRLSHAALQTQAQTKLRAVTQLPNAPVTAPGAEVILPLVADDTIIGYRLVAPLEVDGGGNGRYAGYADPATGEIIAIHQLNLYATGTVLFNGVDRWPGNPYVLRPAPRDYVTIDGAAQTTSQTGGISWSPDSQVSVVMSAVGDLVTVTNNDMAMTPNPTATLSMDPSGQVVWDASATEMDDAHVQAYLDTNIAKEWVRANLDSQLNDLDKQMIVNVNEDNTCNAYWSNDQLNFYQSTPAQNNGQCPSGMSCCNNTARLQDVNFHEYGHDVHAHEIIPGVGNFDSAMSEGAADFLCAIINNDSGMGRGFFFDNSPLRDIDPPDKEYKWPDDITFDPHMTGQIYSGSLWDMRKAFIAQYGYAEGTTLTNKIFVGTLRRSVDIPSSLIEALAEDDDDGNLSNGTPHECTIRAAFGTHGLRTATGTIENPGILPQLTGSIGVSITLLGVSSCGTDQPSMATLSWASSSYNGLPAPGSAVATPNGRGRFTAQLPLSPEGAVQFDAMLNFADGTHMHLPDNLQDKDPGYQLWSGPTVKLYCTDFEDGDPLAHGWTTGSQTSVPSTWALTVPDGSGGPGNPPAAFSGTHILAQAPNGAYKPKTFTWVKTPEIDVGKYTDVHLQYRRWLGVQDANFDQAQITANDTKAWENFTDTHLGNQSAYTQQDKEWRFHDISLSGYFAGTKLVVGWTLNADTALEYSGWALDDVCIVANPAQVCGDGTRGPFEQCDKGSENADLPDQCRTNCRLPTCGDNIVDTGEDCDAGSAGDAKCTKDCKLAPVVDGGCCEAGSGGAGGAAALAAFVGLVLTRRGRNRARR